MLGFQPRIQGVYGGRVTAVQLDGQAALALVRSRTAEELVAGAWAPASDGADQRAKWGGVVMTTIVAKATSQSKNPIRLQNLLWELSGALTTDVGTSLFDLATLSSSGASPTELPHQTSTYAGTHIPSRAVQPDYSTYEALTSAGYDRKCTPAS